MLAGACYEVVFSLSLPAAYKTAESNLSLSLSPPSLLYPRMRRRESLHRYVQAEMLCIGWSKEVHTHIHTHTHTHTQSPWLQWELKTLQGRRFLQHYVRSQLPAGAT